MAENQKKILQMLADGKISVEEASRLLALVGEEEGPGDEKTLVEKDRPSPKYLYVRVEPKAGYEGHKHGRVNVRIPVGLIRAGMKLKALIPANVADDINRAMKSKGMDFDIHNLKDEYVDQLIGALSETEINVDSTEAEVRVYAE